MRAARREIRALQAIERACYPPSVLEEADPLGDLVADGARYRVLRHGTAPVGYIMVMGPEDGGPGVYVADLAILPGHRRHPSVWRQAIGWLGKALEGQPRVEAHCRAASRGMLIRFLQRMGYSVTATDLHDFFPGEVVAHVVGRREGGA